MENERLIRIEESNKSTIKRIETLEDKIDDIFELTISIRELTMEIKEMREDVNKLEKRVVTLEEKPAKRWNGMITQIISLGVAGFMGYLLSNLGL